MGTVEIENDIITIMEMMRKKEESRALGEKSFSNVINIISLFCCTSAFCDPSSTQELGSCHTQKRFYSTVLRTKYCEKPLQTLPFRSSRPYFFLPIAVIVSLLLYFPHIFSFSCIRKNAVHRFFKRSPFMLGTVTNTVPNLPYGRNSQPSSNRSLVLGQTVGSFPPENLIQIPVNQSWEIILVPDGDINQTSWTVWLNSTELSFSI